MKRIIFLFLLCSLSAFAGAQTIADTTKINFFDPAKSWHGACSTLKTYMFPSQTGNSGKYLTTDGSTMSWGTVTGGSGDIVNGGNTTGATVIVGTNDANALNLETNNVARLEITGGASTGGAVTVTNVSANTNTVQDVLTVRSNSSGTAATSFGPGLLFQGESSTTDNRDMVRLSSIWTTATDASRASALVYSDVTGAGSLTERFRFTPTGITTAANPFTIGNGSGEVIIGGGSGSATIGNSSGNVSLYSSQNSTAAIAIAATGNTTSNVGGIAIGPGALSQTSGTRNYMNFGYNLTPTSGTAVHNQLSFTGTLNQTGGANGIIRGINLAHTVTAVADYRAIEIADNGSNVKGIYQTGSTTTNNFVGKTTFGATTTPTALLLLAAGTTTVPPLQQTSGTLNTTALAGGIEYNGTHYRTKASGLRVADSGVIADFYTDGVNIGTSETVLYTYTTPASTLATDGEKIAFNYVVDLSDATATVRLKVKFATQDIADTGALTVSATGAATITGWIVRTSSTTARCSVTVFAPGAATPTSTTYTYLTSLTLSNTNVLSLSGQAGGAGGGDNDITAKTGTVYWQGVAAN